MREPIYRVSQYIASTMAIQTKSETAESSTLLKTLKMVGKVGLGLGLALLSTSVIGAAIGWMKNEDEESWLDQDEKEETPEAKESKLEDTAVEKEVTAAPPKEEKLEPLTIKKTTDWVKPTTVEEATRPASSTELSSVKVNKRSATVETAIDEAAKISGVDKALLLAVANHESQFKEEATVSTSNAVGLFQITKGTWSDLVSKYGKQYGIKIGDRANARANAIMGALYIRSIITGLTKSLGRKPSVTDIYAGHMLGPDGVKKLLKALEENPDADAVELMPKAASSNKWVFKNKDGSNRTVAEVYNKLYGYVGLQYEKFAQEQGTAPVYAGSQVQQQTQVAQATKKESTLSPVKDTTKVEPVAFNIPTQPNTSPVLVTFKIPPRVEVVASKRTEEKVGVNKGVAVMSPSEEKENPNYMRRNGRLLNVG